MSCFIVGLVVSWIAGAKEISLPERNSLLSEKLVVMSPSLILSAQCISLFIVF